MRLRLLYALVAIAVGLVGMSITFWMIVGTSGAPSELNAVQRSFVGSLVYYWTFFTHLTNLGLLLFYIADLWPTRGLAWLRMPVWRASMAAFITLVMLFYHFMLAPYFVFTGAILFANILMHYVTPLMFLLWWAVMTPHGTLRLGQIPLMLAPGVVYVAWVLLRGAVVHEYPYAILDVTKAGYGGVAIGVGILLVAVALFCAILVVVDRGLARRGATA